MFLLLPLHELAAPRLTQIVMAAFKVTKPEGFFLALVLAGLAVLAGVYFGAVP